MTILMTLAIGAGRYAKRKAVEGRTIASLNHIENALVEYHTKNGRYPASLAAAATYLPSNVGTQDAWGRNFVYVLEGPQTYTLYSLGVRADLEADDVYIRR